MRRPFVCSLLIGLILSLIFFAANPVTVSAGTIHHYEYVLTSGFIYVYDMDNGGNLVKRVSVPTTAGVRGAVASAATGMLYISYGSDGNNGGFQLAYNLATDQVSWTMSYSHGIDSQSVSPDGKKIYMPSGELSSGGTWYVEDSSSGNDIGTIDSGGSGPHNTIVSPSGSHVYMGNRDFNLSSSSPGVNDFDIADTATDQVIGRVTPLKSGARPFTINSKETFSFNTVTAFLGFQVGDLTTGKVIYTVAVDGSKIPGYTTQTSATIPSHGISLSPDDKEIYLVDQPNSYVHVFDVTGLPGSPPVQVADIKLVNQMSGNQNECAYDCLRDGWMQHSRDGRFVMVGDSGDVIDTLTRQTIATMPALLDSRVEIEIDFQDSTPIWAATSRSGIGYANPLPPTFTTRITSPNLGSTVSGTNVTVSTSVVDSASISGVDLFKDGTLFASTTSSPYSFTWDTTKDANGSHTLMVTANDTAGNKTSFSATFTVNNVNTPKPPSITTTSLPSGTQNTAYSATLAATGGATPYTWSIISGALPAGLTLASSSGAISGTPTGSGTSNCTVQVTDANSQTATKALSLTISAVSPPPPPPPPPPSTVRPVVIVIGENENGSNTETGMPWLDALSAQYSSATQYYANTHPSIGNYEGMTNGIIETNDDTQCPQTFVINADNVVRQLIAAGKTWKQYAESIPSAGYIGCDATGPDGGTFYTRHAPLPYYNDAQAAAQKVNIVPFTQFAADLAAGTLPAYSFVTPNGCDDGHDCPILTFDNWLKANIAPLLTNAQFVAQGGVLVITWDESANDNTNGGGRVQFVVAGPNVKKAYKSTTLYQEGSLCRWSMELSGAAIPSGCAASPTMAEFIAGTTPPPPPPILAIATTSLPTGTVGKAYSATLAATGGASPFIWSIVTGTLPAGLALAPSTGAISGTPTGSGTSSFTVQVKDANSQTATKSLSLTVNAAPSITLPSITTASLPSGTQKVAYSATLAATAGTPPYNWSLVSGNLPAGLTLAPSTGAISGTPTGSGTSNFTVQVMDANSKAATKSLSLTVSVAPSNTPPSITTTSLPSGTQKVAYNATLTATGGTTPYTWSIVSGTLPAGLALAPGTGAISGTPTGTGTSNFTVRVTDVNSLTATKLLSVTVTATASPSISASSGTPQSATIDAAFAATLIATVRDAGGKPLTGVTVMFTAPAQTGPSGTFAGGVDTAITNANGVATSAVFTANSIPGGPYVVTASVAGAGTPASFSLTNDPKLAASMTVKAGTPQRSIVNTALPTPLKVTVNDASGHPVPGVSVMFTAPSSGASGTFAGGGVSSTVTTDVGGVGTAPTFTTNGIGGGPYNVTASATGITASATFSITNVDFTLAQFAPGTIQLTPGTPANVVLTLNTTPNGSTLPADVNFSCAPNVSMSTTTCTVNPTKISANSPSGITATLTVTSTASLPPAPQRQDPRIPYLPWAAATALAALMTISLAGWQRIVPLRGRMAYLTLALLAVSSAGLMGCVGLTSAQKVQSSVTVTATSGGISKTATININMK